MWIWCPLKSMALAIWATTRGRLVFGDFAGLVSCTCSLHSLIQVQKILLGTACSNLRTYGNTVPASAAGQ